MHAPFVFDVKCINLREQLEFDSAATFEAIAAVCVGTWAYEVFFAFTCTDELRFDFGRKRRCLRVRGTGWSCGAAAALDIELASSKFVDLCAFADDHIVPSNRASVNYCSSLANKPPLDNLIQRINAPEASQ